MSLTLLHTNDMHDRRDSLAWLREHAERDEAVLVDSGDSLRGSNTLWYWDEPIMAEMNQLGYACQAMGNREFHYLRRVLNHRDACRTFPLLCANVVDLRGSATWRTEHVVEHGGHRIGFTAVTPVQYGEGALWQHLFGFRFLAPEAALAPVLERLRQTCDIVVLLSHAGYALDQKLAAALPFDVIIGGHSHTVLKEPTWVGQVPIVQTGSHGRYVGRIRMGGGTFEYELLPSRKAAPVGEGALQDTAGPR